MRKLLHCDLCCTDKMFNYRSIVFGLKHDKHLVEPLDIIKRINYSVIIYEHIAGDEEHCEWPNRHYHGLIEYPAGMNFDKDFNDIKIFCSYFKPLACGTPTEYLAHISIPPRRLILRNCQHASKLEEYAMENSLELQTLVWQQKNSERHEHIEQNKNVHRLLNCIMRSRAHNREKLVELFCADKDFQSLFIDKKFSVNFDKAFDLAKRIVLNKSILHLSQEFNGSVRKYLTVNESAKFVMDWCEFQNIDPKAFATDWINLLDKKIYKKNSLYLHGVAHSGKTYIADSMLEACMLYNKVVEETTGYSYIWQDSADKRMIAIYESHFDSDNLCDRLMKILEGTDVFVSKRNDTDRYLLRTPVLIIANNHGWENESLGVSIKERLVNRYTNLKRYQVPSCGRKLHPGWLNLLKDLILLEEQSPMMLSPDTTCQLSPTNHELNRTRLDAFTPNSGRGQMLTHRVEADYVMETRPYVRRPGDSPLGVPAIKRNATETYTPVTVNRDADGRKRLCVSTRRLTCEMPSSSRIHEP